jgi:hypothetical protein
VVVSNLAWWSAVVVVVVGRSSVWEFGILAYDLGAVLAALGLVVLASGRRSTPMPHVLMPAVDSTFLLEHFALFHASFSLQLTVRLFAMRQSRMESFFEAPLRPPPRPGLSLLDLTPSIRRLIYKHASLVDQTFDLNFSNLLVYPYKQYPDSTYAARSRCAHYDLPIIRRKDETAPVGEEEYWELDMENEGWSVTTEPQLFRIQPCWGCVDGRSLMFVCRLISREVVPFIYANNIFTVRQGAPHGLKRVKLLGVEGMAALKSLTMKLETNKERLRFDVDNVHELPPRPLQLGKTSSRASRASLEDYDAVIRRLGQHVRPNKLAFYLIFGIVNFHMLDEVLRPLFHLPELQQCGLWSLVGVQYPKRVSYCTSCSGIQLNNFCRWSPEDFDLFLSQAPLSCQIRISTKRTRFSISRFADSHQMSLHWDHGFATLISQLSFVYIYLVSSVEMHIYRVRQQLNRHM